MLAKFHVVIKSFLHSKARIIIFNLFIIYFNYKGINFNFFMIIDDYDYIYFFLTIK